MRRRGDRLRALAALMFDARVMERVVDPAVADLQAEPFAISRYLAVIKVMLVCAPEASMRFGMVAAATLFSMAAVIAFLEAPFALRAWNEGAFDIRMLGYLFPQAVSFALTIGLTVGTLGAFAGRRASRQAAAFVMALAVGASVAAFVINGWVVPDSNQAFRAVWFERAGARTPPARNFPEMTLGEARERLSWAIAHPGTLGERDLHYLAVSYEGRLASSIAPVMFTIFALVLGGLRPGRRWAVGLAACAAYPAYLLYLTEPKLVAMDGPWVGGAAWYPLVVLAAVIVVIVTGSLMRRLLARASA